MRRFRPIYESTGSCRARCPEILEQRRLLVANPIISEFMAINDRTLEDGDLRHEDWIEIFNAGDQSLDLLGWHLTDDPENLTKWSFPSEPLDPEEFLVVFASAKSEVLTDQRDFDGNLHTNFRLNGSGEYLALVQPNGTTVATEFGSSASHYSSQFADVSFGFMFEEKPLVQAGDLVNVLVPDEADDLAYGTTWRGGDEIAFENSGGLTGWTSGTGLGVGYDTSGTLTDQVNTDIRSQMNGVNTTAYARVPFQINDPSQVSELVLPITYDDGFVAYINGVEVARRCTPEMVAFDSNAKGCEGGASFPGAVLDFDAGLNVSHSAGMVDSWLAVTGQVATPWNNQHQSSRRPMFVQDVFATGQPGILFDGNDDILTFDDAELPTGDYSIALVWQPLNIGVHGRSSMFSWGDDVENQFHNVALAHHTNTGKGRLIVRMNGTDANSSIPVGGGRNGTSYVSVVTRDGATYTLDISNNSTTEHDEINHSGSMVQLENGRIGNMVDPNNGDFNSARFKGYIGRIVVFDDALDADDRQAVMDQLLPYVGGDGLVPPTGPFTEAIDISTHKNVLVAGDNLLAIHGLNLAANDTDFLLAPQLIAKTLSTEEVGYFTVPTPGVTNLIGFPALAEAPRFSQADGVYSSTDGNLSVDLSSSSVTASIRYTLDGSVPNEESALYVGPLLVSSSSVVRARAYDSGMGPSEVITASYILVHNIVQSFHSDLPIMVIDSLGSSIPGSLSQHQASLVTAVIGESVLTGRATMNDAPEFIGRAGMRARGNASSSYVKKPFSFETWDGYGDDFNVSLLGLPSESDWVLNATWMDRTLMRDPLMFRLWEELGYYSPRFRFVEVYLNTNGGKVEPDDYWGIYILQEKIKQGSDRVNVHELLRSQITAPEITGGYVLQDDRRRFGDRGISSEAGVAGALQGVIFHDPDEQDLSQPQIEWVQTYFNDFEDALFGSNFDDPITGYAKYIDVDAWIEYHILEEFSFNTDAFGASVYMTIDRGGKLTTGPVWDFDGALANSVEFQSFLPQGYIHTQLIPKDGPTAYPWWPRLFQDLDFKQKWIDGWNRLRKTVLDESHIHQVIDQFTAELSEAQQRNFTQWSQRIGQNILTRNIHERSNLSFPTWLQHVQHLKNYISDRLSWLDTNFVASPMVTPGGSPISGTVQLEMTANAGSIYYTLDGSDPRLPAQQTAGSNLISSTAVRYNGTAINVSETTLIKARAVVGQQWSGLTEELFIAEQPASALNLSVSELNFNPYLPHAMLGDVPDSDHDDYEFIELMNFSEDAINLDDVSFTNGVDFTFDNTVLLPGQRTLVVRDANAFESRYGNGLNVAGVFSAGGLSNGGETIELVDATGVTIVEFGYDDVDPWPMSADGHGATLELIVPAGTPGSEYGKAYRWQASTEFGGTPGEAGNGRVGVVINEVLSHTDASVAPSDSIEILNSTNDPVDISGWFLSDSSDYFFKYQIPSETVLYPGQYVVFDESDFNPNPLNPGPNHFALSGTRGDEVWLVDPDGFGSGQWWMVDQVKIPAANKRESFGRVPDGTGRFAPLDALSLAAANSVPRVGPVVISEVNYHPENPAPVALAPHLTDNDLEYVEIYNPTNRDVDLSDWRLRGGVDFDFDPGALLGAGHYLLILSFNPESTANVARLAAFREHYRIDDAVSVVGGYTNQLSNSQDRVELQRMGEPPLTDPNLVSHVLEDQLVFDDRAPWPVAADGGGDSLHRILSDLWGPSVTSWSAGAPSPGRFGPVLTVPFTVDTQVIGETGQLTELTHVSQTVTLSQSYSNPVVLAQPASFAGADPVVVRISNVQTNQFDVRLVEPSNLNGTHGVGESVGYIVLEAGSYLLSDGTRVEVGNVATAATVGKMISPLSWETVDFVSPFKTTPVVMSQVQTLAGTTEGYLSTRQNAVSTTSFDVAMEPEEATEAAHGTQTVGFLAMEPGMGTWGGQAYEARTSGVQFTETFSALHFGQVFAKPPLFVGSMNSFHGYDNSHLRYQNLGVGSIDLKIEEDTTRDTEILHAAPESVSYLAVADEGPLVSMLTYLVDGQTKAFGFHVTEAGLVKDLDVMLELQHSNLEDLDVFLEAPDGTIVELFTDLQHGSADWISMVLDDSATESITVGSTPFSGRFQPEEVLRSFKGKAVNGHWTLHVTDDMVNGKAGSIVAATLVIEMEPVVAGNVNYDSHLDVEDIDLLFAGLGSKNPTLDLDNDGEVDHRDVEEMVFNRMAKRYGDIDLDQDVDFLDVSRLVAEFDPLGVRGIASWSRGDFDGDGDVDVVDFNRIVLHYSPTGYGAHPGSFNSRTVAVVSSAARSDDVSAPETGLESKVVFDAAPSTSGASPKSELPQSVQQTFELESTARRRRNVTHSQDE